MRLTGAQILIRTLIEQGVDTVFGYPGGTVINIFDALGESEIKLIMPSHEQGGAHAADGYARVSGKPGVVIATSGPGATNLVTGIANAYMDSVPLVAITGNVVRRLMGRDSFQEVDICGVTMPVTKHNFLVQNISELAATVKEAFTIAVSGRPGPVLVDIPKDITAELFDYVPAGRYKVRETPMSAQSKLYLAADMISKSKRPLIYGGGGIVSGNACEQLTAFAERGNIPVAASLMGLTALPSAHPLMLGMIGMHGTPVSNFAGKNCDLLISVAARFSDRVAGDRKRFAPNARLIHIDIDPAEFDKNVVCDLHIRGGASEALDELTKLIPENKDTGWINEIELFRRENPMPEAVGGEKVNPRELLRLLRALTDDDAILVTDVGQHQMWAAQYFPFTQPRTFITSGGLGAMGFGMGAAIGAKAANPDKQVILLTGDGSFHMNLTELATSVTSNLPITVIILNNGVLGMVRQWQHLFFGSRYVSTTTGRKTDFVKLAEAFGAAGFAANTAQEAAEALKIALSSNRTSVIDCSADPDEMVFPMIPSGKSGDDIIYGAEVD
ncbi:MAG: biosynthetic-type acetolactate synthase large subunit [Oscillospiraceae bacterium]|nr:biosynthetic-type acetolactate synthase large subunit [Oscillospiraceae bacterium]